MVEYRLIKTKEKVKIGDVIRSTMEQKYSFGSCYLETVETLNANNLQRYIDAGIIEVLVPEKEKVEKSVIPMELTYYINSLAKKLDMTADALAKQLDRMNATGFKQVVFNLLLQEVSQVVDVKYYTEQKKFKPGSRYVIDPDSGKVRTYYGVKFNLPLFCTIEHAELARIILKEQYEKVYGKQESFKC